MDSVIRFLPKVENYIKYRWNFAPEAINRIFDITQLTSDAIVADIGSGSGMLAQAFVERVKQIFAIEPNSQMRAVAEENLKIYPSFVSIDALSDATGLIDNSVDLITVARAIHWFPKYSTKAEFQRILKPHGWLAIINTPHLDREILTASQSIKIPENGWDIAGDKSNDNYPDKLKEALDFYYDSHKFFKFDIPTIQSETWEYFFGRLCSQSPSPEPDHPLYKNFEKAAKEVFNRFSVDGDRIIISAATCVYLGQMSN
ncbi:methylase involved in ubiquinone/menaquinone biosynthesis [Synechococcus sp. PCC 7502]|uniref:class I SAM-dependent methyltransferase n=1 Tax=Synechococcus sp. PCC 7502 TaxID=1173263 RepID=UPI00029FBA57|nr:class I SAM-dependent methyltransferase [Synechococcus sp. PCC 7502]AFY74912.1 methylase involved in ubiquinone/menaquinone biosynthesis [Synechococcus sp. PCC 7502]